MIYIYHDITLRAIEESDLEIIREMMNDPEIENMTGGYSFPISEYRQKKWFENLSYNDKELRTIIETKEHGAIGLAMLTDIDWKNRTAQSSSKIATSVNLRGKGFGTKARKALVKYAFEQLNLSLIYSHIIEYNEASQRVSEKCGYKKDGVLRNRIYKNGKYHDLVVWSIQNGELIE
jgi:RimJ/RimL family protein N-acetyltransferase